MVFLVGEFTIGTSPSYQSERNEAFYAQPGVVAVYQKLQVYPKEGGEFQPEQLRACLPQYRPNFPNDSAGEMDMEMTTVNGGVMDMEMTEVCPMNIATCVLPGIGKSKGKQTVGVEDVLKGRSGYNKENHPLRVVDQENAPVAPGSMKSSLQPRRKPLQAILGRGRDTGMGGGGAVGSSVSRDDSCTAEEELEQLCKENPFGNSVGSIQKAQQGRTLPGEEVDDIDQQLEKLILEKNSLSFQKPLPPSSASLAPREVSTEQRGRLSALKEQENRPQPQEHGTEEGFNFTPGTVAGGPNWPMRVAWSVSCNCSRCRCPSKHSRGHFNSISIKEVHLQEYYQERMSPGIIYNAVSFKAKHPPPPQPKKIQSLTKPPDNNG